MMRRGTLLAIGLAILTLATAEAQENKPLVVYVQFYNQTDRTLKVYKVDPVTKKEELLSGGEIKPWANVGGSKFRESDVFHIKLDGQQVLEYKVEPGFDTQNVTLGLDRYVVAYSLGFPTLTKSMARSINSATLLLTEISAAARYAAYERNNAADSRLFDIRRTDSGSASGA